MLEYLLLLLSLIRATVRDRDALVAENLLLRHQLAILTRPTRKRPRQRARDKLFWLVVHALRRGDWRRHLVVVRPESVIRWQRQAWRLFWRWRSRGRIGRPRLSAEVRELIATMARDNPRWGSERIRGELLKLGLVVSKRSIQRYRRRGPAHPSSQTWRTFLTNHAHHLWAADLLTVQTLTFKTLYVLVFIAHGRRELVHVNVTANPTAAWVWRQVIEATPWGQKPRHLLRDHDAVYGRDFRERAKRIGIDAIATTVASPRANAVIERFIGTLRRECLDHLIILDERHRQSVLGEFVRYYNLERPASDTAPPDAGAGATRGRGISAITPSVGWSASRVRASSLTTGGVLRPYTIPYGVYDLGHNHGFVNIGTSHDTPDFAVESIRLWWQAEGQALYPKAEQLLVLADAGGSNSAQSRVWKVRLQALADYLGRPITVCHLPPGISKWNKIEHRLFAYISVHWRGQPLVDYHTVVSLIGTTTTTTGLTVTARLDLDEYPTGVKVSDAELASLALQSHPTHPQWTTHSLLDCLSVHETLFLPMSLPLASA